MKVMLIVCMSVLAGAAQQQPAAPQHPDNLRQVAPAKTTPAPAKGESMPTQEQIASYVLGPDDEISVRALAVEEINGERPVRVDMSGYINLPLAGRVKVGGLTVHQAEEAIAAQLKKFVVAPEVSINVAEFRSQPVSVLGAVRNPGVYQLRGRKTLVEVLSMAGGLDEAAGSTLKIARHRKRGRIPLEGAVEEKGGEFTTAEVSLKSILDASSPADNIVLEPEDVVTVPRAEMVYVIGQVQRAGGFVLNERKTISVLEALSLAGGLDRTASSKNARILRPTPGATERAEIRLNLKSILDGRAPDQQLQADDILFIPSSTPKRAALRAAEMAISTLSGVIIWRQAR
jgi:polysaccharide export outer membrane protein